MDLPGTEVLLCCPYGIIKYDERKPEVMMLINARGLKYPEPLQKLREAAPSMCSLDGYIDILIDDEAALKQVQTYAVVSGCKFEVKRLDDCYRIRIESSCL